MEFTVRTRRVTRLALAALLGAAALGITTTAGAAEGSVAELPQAQPVNVTTYPAPMLDVDGNSKYIAVVASHGGVEVHRCQHMAWASVNYLSCEFIAGGKSYNALIPIVREAVDTRGPGWNYIGYSAR